MSGQYGNPTSYRPNPMRPMPTQNNMPVQMNYMNRMQQYPNSMNPNPYNQPNMAMINRMSYNPNNMNYQVSLILFNLSLTR